LRLIYIHTSERYYLSSETLKPLSVGSETDSALRPLEQIKMFPFYVLLVLLWWYPYAPSPWCFLFFPQNEIEHRTEEALASPQHAGPQPAYNVTAANVQGNPFSFGNIAAALDSRMDETDQTRNSGISNALPCPLRQNFPSNYLSQPSGYGPMNSLPNVNGPRNHSLQNQDSMRYNLWGRCGYALWWSLKVRTMWRFDSSLSRSIQVFTIWSSLAGAFRVSYLLAEGTPSICDDVFVNCHLWVGCHQRCVFVQSSWEIELQNCGQNVHGTSPF